jgi:uncharacterized protein (TIGR03435 family)
VTPGMVVAAALAVFVPCTSGRAQQPSAESQRIAAAGPPAPVFEVASIKPNRSVDARPGFQAAPGGRYIWTAITLKALIDVSYQRNAFDNRETAGGPAWVDKDRFDVLVKAEEGAALNDKNGFPGPLFSMIRAMLADRFALQAHNEVRERPVYALTLARPDKRLGSGLKKVDADCAAAMRELAAPTPGAAPRRGAPPCTFGGGPGRLLGNNVSLAMFASVLSRQVGRPVVDRTGVADYFDITLEFAPDLDARTSNGPPAPNPPAGGDGPSIFTALQEQLGLKLDATRAPVDVLVIDRAEPPTEN